MRTLEENFLLASPRRKPGRVPAASWLIHGAVLLLFLVLLARAFWLTGLFAWSAGLVYVGYDTLLQAFTLWQTRALRHKAPPPAAGPGPRLAVPGLAVPRLAVIVAAYNEAAILAAALAALAAQSDRPDLVLVADDGSTDDTAALLREMAPESGLNLRHLALPHAGKARALNAALGNCETEIVLTVDADTRLAAGAIAAMRQAFAADPALVAATGVLQPLCGTGLGQRAFQWFQTYEYVRNFLSRYAWMRADGLLLISGAFAGFRRNAVMAVGGFDPDCLVEDYELIHRLRRVSAQQGLGWTTAVLGHALATTEAPGTVSAFLRQRRRWFGGFLQTQFWYRDMVGNPAYGRVGTAMLPVKAADTFQPFYGLVAFGLLVFYLLTGNFAVLLPAGGVMGGKIAVDLGFHLWSVRLYRRWVGPGASPRFSHAVAAALLEPFCFQLLRHAGAAAGWAVFLSGQRGWGRQQRMALNIPASEERPLPG